jgi:hypothetical protein
VNGSTQIQNERRKLVMVINDNEAALPLTPEQIGLKIEELKTQQAADNLARSTAETARLKAQQDLQETNAEITLRQSIAATGVTYYPDSGELKTILKSMGFLFTASTRGDVIRVLDPAGKNISLEAALERLAVDKPFLVSGDTARHLRPRSEQGEFAEVCRDDFKTFAAKSRWISENPGKWESLPQQRAPKTQPHLMTASEYSRLSVSQKSKIIGEVGPEGVSEILKRR